MNKNRLLIVAVISVAAIIAVALLTVNSMSGANTVDSSNNGISLRPDFSLPDIQGDVRNIKEWDGKFIVLNFWATWCPPCRKEIPEFIALQKEYADLGLQFVGVAIDDQESVSQFSMEMDINYPNLIAETQGIDLARQYGNTHGALPFSVIIGPKGQILARQIGILSRAKILQITQLSKD